MLILRWEFVEFYFKLQKVWKSVVNVLGINMMKNLQVYLWARKKKQYVEL